MLAHELKYIPFILFDFSKLEKQDVWEITLLRLCAIIIHLSHSSVFRWPDMKLDSERSGVQDIFNEEIYLYSYSYMEGPTNQRNNKG